MRTVVLAPGSARHGGIGGLDRPSGCAGAAGPESARGTADHGRRQEREHRARDPRDGAEGERERPRRRAAEQDGAALAAPLGRPLRGRRPGLRKSPSRHERLTRANLRTDPGGRRRAGKARSGPSRAPAREAGGAAVDARSAAPARTRRRRPVDQTRLNSTTAFVPPNPNEFDIAKSTRFSRAVFGMTSRAQSGSCSSTLIVGGRTPRAIARTVTAPSSPPAAPRRWPVIDFVDETISPFFAWSP